MGVKSLVKRGAAFADRIAPPKRGITVLIYHRVGGESPSDVDLDPAVFESQLEHLTAHHRVISLDAAIDELTSPAAGETESAVVLTFDDGTADFTDIAVPILERHRVPATLYAATQFIDSGDDFPWGAPPTSWSALRDAIATGFVTVGSHTHSHRLLDRLDPRVVEEDLDRSIELIGNELGTPEHFAYPKAVPASPSAEIVVRQRFRSAALASGRVNRPGACDPFRLWRTPVQRSDTPRHFAAKAAGGMRLEGELRALVARRRYRGAKN